MSTNEMNSKVRNLRELLRMAEELEVEIESAKDEIKAEMVAQNTDTLTGADWKVTWKEVKSSRFDSTAFKKTHEELYCQYSKETVSKRFTVA